MRHTTHTHTLIIGAGPFGLSLAAYAKRRGIDYLILGKPMEFWIANMPKGLYLRSGCDWHLDPDEVDTIERYLEEHDLTVRQVMPLSLDCYLDYAQWFIERQQFEIHPAYVTQLNRTGGAFEAVLDDVPDWIGDGSTVIAHNVVIAIGFRYFAHVPEDVAAVLPAGRYSHTCETVNLEAYADKQVLIIGGRQSAFEWAALLRECGAAHVHLSYRHDSPRFTESDWSWVSAVVNGMVDDPAWFRKLPDTEKERYRYRLWAEGRLKVEPWLDARVRHDSISLHPRTRVVGAKVLPSGAISVALDNGEQFVADHVIAATGYKVDVRRVPFLANGNLLDQLNISNGYPCLDEHFQSSVPGLFFTSFPAGQDFGSFFGFTIGVRAAARILGSRLRAHHEQTGTSGIPPT